MKREQIVSKAREWIGTKFLHQGRVKGLGVDCVGLPLCVAEELQLKDVHGTSFKSSDYTNYARQPIGGFVHKECVRRMKSKSVNDLKAGDVVTLKVPTEPCHVAIIAVRDGVLYMIHAYCDGTLNRVVEHILDAKWKRRIVGCFEFSEVED